MSCQTLGILVINVLLLSIVYGLGVLLPNLPTSLKNTKDSSPLAFNGLKILHFWFKIDFHWRVPFRYPSASTSGR